MNQDSKTARDQKRDMRHGPSHLFLLRLWLGEIGASQGPEEWYGRVQHAVTGEARYFHGCLELAEVLRCMMPQSKADRAGDDAGDSEQEDER